MVERTTAQPGCLKAELGLMQEYLAREIDFIRKLRMVEQHIPGGFNSAAMEVLVQAQVDMVDVLAEVDTRLRGTNESY